LQHFPDNGKTSRKVKESASRYGAFGIISNNAALLRNFSGELCPDMKPFGGTSNQTPPAQQHVCEIDQTAVSAWLISVGNTFMTKGQV
jgi:hypothetical protein